MVPATGAEVTVTVLVEVAVDPEHPPVLNANE
jgi:hypothetical protein